MDNPELEEVKQAVLRLAAANDYFLAGHLMLGARVESLQALVIESLGKLGIESADQGNLQATLKRMEKKACHSLLAKLADNSPRVATELKKIVEQTFDSTEASNPSDDLG